MVANVHDSDQSQCSVECAPGAGQVEASDKRSRLDMHKEWLLELIAEEADLTLEEIRGRLRGRGIAVSTSSVWRFFDRHNITFKKKPARGRTGSRRRPRGTHKMETRAAAA